jgi:4-hydroxy-tetrahydrodipicolinate synthase
VEVVRITVSAADGRVPVVPGVAAYATHDAIAQGRRMVDLGADGIVLILQTYFPLPPSAVFEFFSSVATAVPCPIVLYSNPRLLGAELSPEQVVALSEIPNVQYFKEASGETGKILTVLNRAGDRVKVFSASAHVPLLVFRPRKPEGLNLGLRSTLSDIGQTVAENFGTKISEGASFLAAIN